LIGLEFKGSSAGHNHLFRSGWGTWLDNFAEDLIANKSFEKVFSANSSRVLKSLDAVDAYCLYPNAVELPGRYINYPGSQDVLIQICWRHYDNRQIGEEMRKFAADRRPQNEPEPKRTGKKRKSRVRADLKALSVLRIWKLHKRNPWERLRLVAKVCGYKNCKEEAAAYEERRKRWHAKEPMSNAAKVEMSDARDRACKLFECWFPWGKPSNFEASDRKGKVNLK
jgi:hypothetical protein